MKPTLPAHRSLEATIALVTAMYEEIESGNNLTDAQIAAAFHDQVLGTLYCRFIDYATYCAKQHGRMHHYAFNDDGSIALAEHLNEYFSEDLCGAELQAFLDQNLREALTPSPEVLRWRRREQRKQRKAAA